MSSWIPLAITLLLFGNGDLLAEGDPSAIRVAPPDGSIHEQSRVRLHGDAPGFRTVSVNGKPTRITDGAFQLTIKLKPGENLLEIEWTPSEGEPHAQQHRLWYCVDDWDRVIADVASIERSPTFRGLKIKRQKNLTPLRKDPISGLWEFLVADTGASPEFSGDEPYRLDERFGIVLVLIPPATYLMGNPSGTARGDERPQTLVRVDAFYVAKYETTQGQWKRLARGNPSFFRAGKRFGGRIHTMRHPVEKVTWSLGRKKLASIGLSLPTEAQWEHACRAGTTTQWSFGDDPTDHIRYGNVLDQSAVGTQERFELEPWDDGFPFTAPVGAFEPNPFGLFDMHGNVWEWCEDGFRGDAYKELRARAGDGLREVSDPQTRAIRGGSYFPPTSDSHSAERAGLRPNVKARGVGLRAALYPVGEVIDRGE